MIGPGEGDDSCTWLDGAALQIRTVLLADDRRGLLEGGDGEADVVGGERLPVMPLDAFLDENPNRLSAVEALEAADQPRLLVSRDGTSIEQPIEDQ